MRIEKYKAFDLSQKIKKASLLTEKRPTIKIMIMKHYSIAACAAATRAIGTR